MLRDRATALKASHTREFSGATIVVRCSAWLFFLVVALAPLPLGSAGVVAPAFWAILLGCALPGLLALRPRTGQLAVLVAVAILAIAYLIVMHDQLAIDPWLPVAPNPLWQEVAPLIGANLRPSVAIARNQPFFSAGLAIVWLLALAGGVMLGTDRRLARQLLLVVAIAGAAYAMVGVATFIIDPSRVFLLYEKQAHIGSLTSPFINRNTAAVYYGCCALIWLMLCLEQIERHLPSGKPTWSRFRRRLDRQAGKKIIIFGIAWLICLLAMFLTVSRAGVGVSLLTSVGAAVAFFHRRFHRSRAVAIMAGGGMIAALVLLEVMGGGVGGRFSSQGLSDEGRFSTYRAVWRIISDYPWLGTGFGTFEWVYPAYRTDDISMSGIWNRAHNSFLELAAGGGMLITAIVIIALIAVLAILAHGIRTRRRDLIFPVVALFSTLAAVLHSNVDFSLQIPGYAIVIAGVLGIGLAQSFRTDPNSSKTEEPRAPEALGR